MSIQRRNFLKSVAGAGLLGITARHIHAQEQVTRAMRGMPSPRIKDISVIECQPAGVRLTVVKITTDQDGLIRLWMRHLYTTCRSGKTGSREIFETVPPE